MDVAGRELDPQHTKAMRRLYELQDALEARDPFLAQVRTLAESVVNHYKNLGYHETAEAALKARPEGAAANASPAGEVFAKFQLARAREEAARRELDALLQQFGGDKKVTLTDAMKAAVAAHTQFIADHPTDRITFMNLTCDPWKYSLTDRGLFNLETQERMPVVF